ncbi:MAG: allantoicase [Proteobacteria bacterium]|nr:allantoicase [Pseudomonadota bacterium]
MSSERHPFHAFIRLEQPRLGSRVTFASDEFFAAKERLIDPSEPKFIDDKYDDHGKWMDGWESRRRRTPGHDSCIIRLGVAGVIRGLDIDTSFFTGNFPPQASIDVCTSDEDVPEEGWSELLAKTDLSGDTHQFIAIQNENSWTHLRLNIFPDGGIARLRVYGEVKPEPSDEEGMLDLIALRHGGRALACSDEHYGSMHNLNLPGRGINMGDGWETARRRGPGNDWVILMLGQAGTIERVEVDTAHFKGNYPDRVSLEVANFANNEDARNDSDQWRTLLPESKLSMDQQHFFESELKATGTITHARVAIFPDGGISRLRLFGRAARSE